MALIIAQLGLKRDALAGETVIVTGAGGGIGYEAARALLWLGANVVIAEINTASGVAAERSLAGEFGPERSCFVPTDVGDEGSVSSLCRAAVERFGKVDAVINNATIAALGAVKDLPIQEWDASYRVNLRGPVLLARTFLPAMIDRRHGVFVCVSSTGTAYLGGYETFKAAQVHLANTLDAELEGTGVVAFTIGPGLVPTETASRAVGQLAPLMGLSVDEFFAQNKGAVLTVEEAGAGFAASIALAPRFKGTEISSLAALKAARLDDGSKGSTNGVTTMDDGRRRLASAACSQVLSTLQEQVDGWRRRSLFERQWVIRDFRKQAGMSAEEWLDVLAQLKSSLDVGGEVACPPWSRLAGYYEHLADLAKGYEKDSSKLEDNLRHVYRWRDEVTQLESVLA